MDVARENALNSLAREIRVNVGSESVLSPSGKPLGGRKFLLQILHLLLLKTSKVTLLLAVLKMKTTFRLYQLSKSEYARILAERKRVALGIAYGHY